MMIGVLLCNLDCKPMFGRTRSAGILWAWDEGMFLKHEFVFPLPGIPRAFPTCSNFCQFLGWSFVDPMVVLKQISNTRIKYRWSLPLLREEYSHPQLTLLLTPPQIPSQDRQFCFVFPHWGHFFLLYSLNEYIASHVSLRATVLTNQVAQAQDLIPHSFSFVKTKASC